MLFGNISERPGGVFLASVHEGGSAPSYDLVDGELVQAAEGEWLRAEDVEQRYQAHGAFPSLEAAQEWCAWHIERRGEPVPAMTGGGGSWKLWPQ